MTPSSACSTWGNSAQPIWFHAGDRDLAVHILRSKLLAEGKTLSEVTAEISDKLGVKARILPMSNSRVETRVGTPIGELSFEEYFVQRWYQDPVESIRFAGAADAEPAPGVIEAIMNRGHGVAGAEQSGDEHRADPGGARHARGVAQNQGANRGGKSRSWPERQSRDRRES